MKQKFDVTGMTCSACSAHVEKSVRKLNGTQSVAVNLLQNSMTVDYDSDIVDSGTIIQAVEHGGYGASLKGNDKNKIIKNVDDSTKAMKKRMIWSIIFLVPLFYICMGHMFNIPLPPIFIGHNNMMIFALTQLFLTIPIVILNKHYFVNGFQKPCTSCT